MIRPITRAARPMCRETQCAASQQRFKTFVRRVDKNDEVYYTLAKRRAQPDQEASSNYQEFFEMPDVILDLDGEGLEGVRSYEDADEQSLAAKWGASAKKQAAKETVRSLEEEINEARQQAEDVLTNPTNAWRLTSHDILSTALNGSRPAGQATQLSSLSSQRSSIILDTIRRENGIPAHVQDSDALLLEWLLLRQTKLKQYKKHNDDRIASPQQLVDALRQQKSVVAIRRLVSQQLNAPKGIYAYFGQPHGEDIVGEIRNACKRVLASETSSHADHVAALVFIGNLTDSLAHAKVAIDKRLCGFALRLSAETNTLGAAYEWLHRSHFGGEWPEDVEFADDACEAISALEARTQSESTSPAEGQFLLQLLTGLDETGKLASDSFRSLASFYSQGDAATGVKLYEAYVAVLGHIGAVRTVTKEQQLSVEEFGAASAKKLGPAFEQALTAVDKAAGGGSKEDVAGMNLEDCVTLDYHAIESEV